MKWTSKIPRYGQKRIVKRFLLFPKRVDREWRWLETAYIFQEWNVEWESVLWSHKEAYERIIATKAN